MVLRQDALRYKISQIFQNSGNLFKKKFRNRGGKIPIRSATAFSSLSLRGRPRAEGAEQAPVERSACKGNFHWKIPATQKKETEVSMRLSNFVLLK